MKKLLFLILLFPFWVLAQNTVTVETGTNTFTPQFRYKAITPDSLNHLWMINPTTGKANRIFTATEANLIFGSGGSSYTFTSPLNLSGTTVSIPQSTTSVDGFLSHTDWNTFNGKLSPTGNGSGLTGFTSGQITGALGFTPPNQATTLTINGTTFDLSANRSWTIGGGLTSANNGLSLSSTTAQLGGALIKNTVVTNSGFRLGISDSLYVGVPNAYSTPSAGSIAFFGTSITQGTGTNAGNYYGGTQYSTLVAAGMGLTEINLGVSGSAVELRTPGALPAGPCFLTRIGTLTYSATTKFVVVEVGPGDFIANSANYNPANYQTDLTTFINDVIALGYTPNQILILSNSYVNDGIYSTGLQSSATYQGFITATHAVATALGTKYLDIFNLFSARGGNNLLADNLHPNNAGHALQAQAILAVLNPPITYRNAQNFATQNAQLASLNLISNPPLSILTSTLLGRDSSGTVGQMITLPNNISTGANFYINRIIQNGSTVGSGYTLGSQDILLNSTGAIYDQTVGTFTQWTKTILNTGGVGYSFYTNFNNPNSTLATFSTPAGAALTIQQNGLLTVYNNNVLVAPGFGMTSYSGSAVGILIPFDAGGNTLIKNSTPTGYVATYTSRGTSGSYIEASRTSASGDLLLGGIYDNGYYLDNYFNTRSQGNFVVGILQPPTSLSVSVSATGGTIPAGTKYAQVVTVDAFGNTTNPLTPESAVATTGATSSVTYSWGAVTGATSYRVYLGTTSGGENKYISTNTTSVTDIGSGYTTAALPTLNLTGLAGISSTGILSAVLPAYSSGTNLPVVYNSTNNRFETGTGGGGGSGTVTLFSVVTANGVSATVANATTTPAATFTLGNITPTSINTTHLPANIFQTAAGTAGADSLAVKIGSTGKIGAIAASYYQIAGTYLTPTSTNVVTNKDLTSGTNTFPTFNQNTTGSAAKLTTARNINGVAFDGTAAISINLNNSLTPAFGLTPTTAFNGGAGLTLTVDTAVAIQGKTGFNTAYTNLSGRITTNTTNIATNTASIATKEGLLTLTAVKTANYTLSPYDIAIGDVTSGTFTFTLPNAPADGTLVEVKMNGQTGTNAISLVVQGVDVFNGGGTTASLVQNFQAITFKYKLSNHTWYSTSTNLALGLLDTRYLLFANQGTATTVYHGNATGNGSFGSIVNADIAAGTIDLTAKVTGLLPDANISSAANWNTTYTNRITSLATTGSSGASTLTANVLNIPTYTLSGLGGVPTTTTVAGFALSGNITLATLTAGSSLTNTVGSNYNGSAATTLDINLANTNTFTVIQNINKAGIGTTPTDALLLENTTAAILNTQQYSSAINFAGFGWGTTASTSQSVNGRIYLVPIQGGTPSSQINFDFANSGGTYTNRVVITNGGNITSNGGALSMSLGGTFGSMVTATRAGITASTDGFLAQNTTAATSGNLVEFGPRYRSTGAAWTGSASQSADWIWETQPISGTTPITSKLVFSSQINAGGYTGRLSLDNSGNLSLLTGNLLLGSTGLFSFNGTIGTAGQIPVVNPGATAMTWANGVTAPNGAVTILASSQTTLVAGTKAISVTGVTTGSHAYVNSVSQGGTVSTTFEYAAVCTAGTLTITALTTGNVTNNLDTSVVNYFITN